MYYNSNNDSHSQEPWDRPIETTGRSLDNEYVPDEPGHSGKKKGQQDHRKCLEYKKEQMVFYIIRSLHIRYP